MCLPLNCFHAAKTLHKIVFLTRSLAVHVSFNVNAYLEHMSYRKLLYTLYFETMYLYKSYRQRCLHSILFVDLPSNKGNHIQWQLVHFSHIEGAISVLLRLRIIFIFIFRHHFDHLRTRGSQFCPWLMWPQPIVITIDCNFPHIWFSQCWNVFCQLHSIGYRNQFLVATFVFSM